jgi:hypothetical protein
MRVCVLAILLAGAAWAQHLPRATSELGSFALPDERGARLIAMPEMPDAIRVRKAVCSDGSSVPVRYERRQVEREGANGRQSPKNFDRLAGDVFRVLRGRVGAGAACFLAGPGWISGASVVPGKVPPTNSPCEAGIAARISASRNRAVVTCFSLGRIDRERRVLLAEYERIGGNALASVILTDRDRLLFADYPATFRRDGQDLWRVDDGGKLSAEAFQVVFVAQKGRQCALGVSWAGSEGLSLAVFLSGDGILMNRVIDDYWYQMPE